MVLENARQCELCLPEPSAFLATARDFLRYFNITPAERPSLATLATVLNAFLNIPYENLSKIIKYQRLHQDTASLRLPDEVWEDYRRYGLGGTCFSLTFFLRCIVEALGFTGYPVMGHMKAGPNHHCALIVVHEGVHYLLDPGYVLDVPMALADERPRAFRNAHSGVELRPGEQPREYHLFTFQRDQARWRYTFMDVPVASEQFLQHWLASFHWNGMNGLCLTRVRKDSLIFIHNHFMRETRFDGRQNFNLKRNREQTIHALFGIPAEIIEQAETAIRLRLMHRHVRD